MKKSDFAARHNIEVRHATAQDRAEGRTDYQREAAYIMRHATTGNEIYSRRGTLADMRLLLEIVAEAPQPVEEAQTHADAAEPAQRPAGAAQPAAEDARPARDATPTQPAAESATAPTQPAGDTTPTRAEKQPAQGTPAAAPAVYAYYCTQRPAAPGSIPRGPLDVAHHTGGPLDGLPRVYAVVTYAVPLDPSTVAAYELTPAAPATQAAPTAAQGAQAAAPEQTQTPGTASTDAPPTAHPAQDAQRTTHAAQAPPTAHAKPAQPAADGQRRRAAPPAPPEGPKVFNNRPPAPEIFHRAADPLPGRPPRRPRAGFSAIAL